QLQIGAGASLFGVTGVERRNNEAADAAVESVDATRPIVLSGQQVADVFLAFQPNSSGPAAGTLSVGSDSPTHPHWDVALRGGGGPGRRRGGRPGERGVFFLQSLGCTVVPAGQTLTAAVEYRPFAAGEHVGEIVVGGAGAPQHIALLGRVIGAHICFRTEDDRP